MNYRKAYLNMRNLIDELPEGWVFAVKLRVTLYGKKSRTYQTDYENLVMAVKKSIHHCYERGHGALDYVEPFRAILDEGRSSLLIEDEQREPCKRTPCMKGHARQLKKCRMVGYGDCYYWKKTSKSWKDQSKKRHQYE